MSDCMNTPLMIARRDAAFGQDAREREEDRASSGHMSAAGASYDAGTAKRLAMSTYDPWKHTTKDAHVEINMNAFKLRPQPDPPPTPTTTEEGAEKDEIQAAFHSHFAKASHHKTVRDATQNGRLSLSSLGKGPARGGRPVLKKEEKQE